MAEYKQKMRSLPNPKDAVDASMQRRSIKGTGAQIKDMFSQKETVSIALMGSVAMMAIFPQAWAGILPATLGYYSWISSRKFRLPFKVPQSWGGIDYGAPKPGGSGFGKAGGILYLGQDQASLEELWIENGDARRHGFFLGTTGSGKALPLDTPVLTTRGWVMNGELGVGDELIHPFGGTTRVLSVHPQGKVRGVRIWFADGRHADCCNDHLWHVKARAKLDLESALAVGEADYPEGFDARGRIMTAGDLGIMHGMHGEGVTLSIPLARAHDGHEIAQGSPILSDGHAIRAAAEGLHHLNYMPSLHGNAAERINFLRTYLRHLDHGMTIERHGVRLARLRLADAKILKQIIWSLGGMATVYAKSSWKEARDGVDLTMIFPDIAEIWPQAAGCQMPGQGDGLEITGVEPLHAEVEMSCVKTSRDDGLYVMENHIVTHNTELLLGVVSQTLMWSSGFLFIDGKGTTEFYARAWTLCKRFGREDDIRVLNFTDAGGDPDAPAGGPAVQSNTLNPFAKGGADQLMNLIVGLMGDAGSGNDMWKNRAMSLVTAAMKALCIMRDSGDILLDVQAIRDYLPLGTGVKKELLKNKTPKAIEDIPEEAWEEMRTRGGMIELYMRALKGDFSNSSKLALKAFFDTLPGFSMDKAMKGDSQDAKASEQYGFLSMQLTKPLGSLADDYGHIFRTPLGEVDIDDVVLNRRILVVLLPALQKAPEEMEMCGRIVVNLVKIMMGNASGSMLQGTKQEIIDAKQTRAPSPFIVVLDEAGYYMVKGIDVMMAQARSLGFMIIVAGQDMAAMQSKSPQIAETAAANASIAAVGKTVDADKTLSFVQKLFGRAQVSVTSGYSAQPGAFGNRWADRMDVSFQEVDRVKGEELQEMMEGEFYFLFNGTLVRAATFYIGGDFAGSFSVNKFLKVRGPTDRVPGLNQDVEINFLKNYVNATEQLLKLSVRKEEESLVQDPDGLTEIAGMANAFLWKCAEKAGHPSNIHGAWLGAALNQFNAATATAADVIDDDHAWSEEMLVEGDIPGLRRGEADGLDVLDEYMLDEMSGGLRGMGGDRPGRGRSGSRAPMRDAVDDLLADGDESDIVRGLSSVARGRTTQERHSGLIDLLVAQESARSKAQKNREIMDLIAEGDASTRAASLEKSRSLGEFFTVLAENSSRFAKAFAEEDIDGDLGLEILRRSGNVRPLPLDSFRDGKFMTEAVGELEKIISTEQI
ncbi:TraM recognition domain-containing protein [Paracoccus litorisediminis]|uniref:TraM recognition domain-containing protein n=1 Tax=Paracoccus litorisediminis TaxID=2006130 RepID=UPI00372D8C42